MAAPNALGVAALVLSANPVLRDDSSGLFARLTTTAQKAQVLNTANGTLVTSVPTGTYSHANDYSANGAHIYNSSIGTTSIPRALNFLKGQVMKLSKGKANPALVGQILERKLKS